MSNGPTEDSLDFDDLPECPDGISLTTTDQERVERWVGQYGDKLLEIIKPHLTVLDEAVMKNEETASPTAVAMTPAVHLDVENENRHLSNLAVETSRSLGKPDVVNKVRSVLVYLLRRGFQAFKTKNCVPGTDFNYESIKGVLKDAKRKFDQRVSRGKRPHSTKVPEEVFMADLRAETAVDLVRTILKNNIPTKINIDNAEMRERILRALKHARSLYKELGDSLFKEGDNVTEMYRELTGDTALTLPQMNPLTALDNDTVGCQSFTELAWQLLEGMEGGDTTPSKKEKVDLYHVQVILWFTLIFFQLNLRAAASKAEIDETIGRKVTDFITKTLGGVQLVDVKENISGKKEPVIYRKISVNGHEYLVYSGENPVSKKRRPPAMLKVMRNKADRSFTLVDEERGELMIDQSSEAFQEGSDVVEDCTNLLTQLAEQLGCTMVDPKTDYGLLKPGTAVIIKKLGEAQKPESFGFATIKCYMHLEFVETKTGKIILIDSEEIRNWARTQGLPTHTAHFEFRIVPKDIWIKAQYDKKHPSYHDYYRLKQMISITKLAVRPAENPELYEYMETMERMLLACEQAVLKKDSTIAETDAPHSDS